MCVGPQTVAWLPTGAPEVRQTEVSSAQRVRPSCREIHVARQIDAVATATVMIIAIGIGLGTLTELERELFMVISFLLCVAIVDD